MPFITLASGLTIKVPTQGTQSWADTMRTDTFEKISSHDHSGGGNGSLLDSSSVTASNITSKHTFTFTDGATNENITSLSLDPALDSERAAIISYSIVRKGTANLNEVGQIHCSYTGAAWVMSREYSGDDALVTFNFNGNQLRMSNTANPASTSEALYWSITKLGV